MVQVFIRQTDAIWSIETSTETFETTDEHPFWVVGEGFVAASELTVGSVLLSQVGQEIAVTGIRTEVRDATVYNFEVEEFHTYYVGTEKVLVHNTCDGGNEAPQAGNVTRQTIKRGKPGADGGASEHIIEKMDGKTISKTHRVTKDGKVVHQHQDHVGKHGGERRFPDEWTGTDTINAPEHITRVGS